MKLEYASLKEDARWAGRFARVNCGGSFFRRWAVWSVLALAVGLLPRFVGAEVSTDSFELSDPGLAWDNQLGFFAEVDAGGEARLSAVAHPTTGTGIMKVAADGDTGGIHLVLAGGGGQDMTVEAWVFCEGNDGPTPHGGYQGIVARASHLGGAGGVDSTENFVRLAWDPDRSEAGDSGDGWVKLQAYDGTTWDYLGINPADHGATANGYILNGTTWPSGWHRFKLVVTGDQVQAYVDDMSTPVATGTLSISLRNGRGGFYVYSNGDYAGYFDDFRSDVTPDTSPPPPDFDSWNVEVVGHVGSSYNAVAVQGNYAYVASDSGFSVLDVTNPADPQPVGGALLGSTARAVAVSGAYAYVAGNLFGLWVFDVSTPSSPVRVGHSVIWGRPESLAVSGDYAYVACRPGGLRVIDISSPSNPVEVGFYAGIRTGGVAVSGNYACVTDYDFGLRVMDVTTPASPVLVGSLAFTGGGGGDVCRGVAVSGTHAYVGVSGEGLRVVDISTPSSPVEVGYWNYPMADLIVTVSGNYAYVNYYQLGSGDLHLIDISTPSNPTEVGSYHPPDPPVTTWHIRSVAVSGTHAYVADGRSGLRVIDVSVPSNPNQVGHFSDVPRGWASPVTASGNYVYAFGGGPDNTGGLHVIDVSVPSSPVAVGFADGGSPMAAPAGRGRS